MTKPTLIIILLFTFITGATQNVLLYKKKHKTIEQFWLGSTISFQLKDKEWKKGVLTKAQNDSFYIRPYLVNYKTVINDTTRFNEEGYSFSDIYAMPKRGVLIYYANSHYKIQMDGGHQHLYWIKSGFIFRLGAAAYAMTHIINGLIKNNLSFETSKQPLGIAAAVFAGGTILHESYKLTHRIRRKYHFEILKL